MKKITTELLFPPNVVFRGQAEVPDDYVLNEPGLAVEVDVFGNPHDENTKTRTTAIVIREFFDE